MAFLNLLMNSILLVPLGLYMSVLWGKRKFGFYPFVIFLASISIEVIQFAFRLGVADVDDVILNFIGGIVGLVIYNVLLLLFKEEYKVRLFIVIMSGLVVFVFFIFIAVQLF
jgi:glycopeptide antibiotics resistance protein